MNKYKIPIEVELHVESPENDKKWPSRVKYTVA